MRTLTLLTLAVLCIVFWKIFLWMLAFAIVVLGLCAAAVWNVNEEDPLL